MSSSTLKSSDTGSRQAEVLQRLDNAKFSWVSWAYRALLAEPHAVKLVDAAESVAL